MEPFVRWAGGKTWLIPHMADLLGEVHIEHYHEPFLNSVYTSYAKMSSQMTMHLT